MEREQEGCCKQFSLSALIKGRHTHTHALSALVKWATAYLWSLPRRSQLRHQQLCVFECGANDKNSLLCSRLPASFLILVSSCVGCCVNCNIKAHLAGEGSWSETNTSNEDVTFMILDLKLGIQTPCTWILGALLWAERPSRLGLGLHSCLRWMQGLGLHTTVLPDSYQILPHSVTSGRSFCHNRFSLNLLTSFLHRGRWNSFTCCFQEQHVQEQHGKDYSHSAFSGRGWSLSLNKPTRRSKKTHSHAHTHTKSKQRHWNFQSWRGRAENRRFLTDNCVTDKCGLLWGRAWERKWVKSKKKREREEREARPVFVLISSPSV